MVIKGDTNILKIYDLTDLIELDGYDLDNFQEIEKFQDTVASYIDSGEAETLSFENELVGVVPEGSEINIDENSYTFEDVTYKNRDINGLITEKLNENDIVAILNLAGDGYFEYEQNPKIDEIEIGYSACDIFDLEENAFNSFCDLMLPYDVSANGEKLEVVATNFYPKDTIVAEVYVIKSEEGKKYFQKVCDIDILHFNWDDLEDIIQVSYDE